MVTARRVIERARRTGCTAGCSSPTDSRAVHRSGAPRPRRGVARGRRPLVPPSGAPAARRGRPAGSPATPGATTTRDLRAGLDAVAGALRSRRLAGAGRRRRQRPRRPGGRRAGRPRLVRQEHQPPAPGPGVVVRARLRGHRRRPAGGRGRSPTGAGRAAGAIDGCPTGAIVAPGVIDARRCLAWLVQAPGDLPAGAPGRPRRPHLRLRRLPGRVPPNRVPAPAPARSPPSRDRRRGSTLVALLERPTTTCWRPLRSLVHPPARARGTCAATPSSCSATSATGATPRPTRCSGAASPTTTPLRPSHAVWAARRLGRDDLCARPGGRRRPVRGRARWRRTRRSAVKRTSSSPTTSRPSSGGIQSYLWELWRRLPPETFTVLTTPARGARPRFDAEQAFRVVRIAASRCCCRTRGWPAASTPPPRRSAPSSSCSTRPSRSALVGRHLRPALRGRRCTVPRSPCPAACPSPAGPRRRVLRGADPSWPPAATRRPRPSGPPAGRSRVHVIPPGVDTDRFRPLRRAGPPWPPGAASACPGRPARARPQPPRAPQGLRRPDRGRGRAGRPPARPAVVVIGGGGRDRARLRRGSRAGPRRPVPLPRSGPRRRPAGPLRRAPTSSPCSAGTGGAASSRRASASSSSRRRRPASPRWRAAAAAPTRPSSTARPASCVDDPKDVGAVAAALVRLLDDDALRDRMGRAARARAERELSYDVLVGLLQVALG